MTAAAPVLADQAIPPGKRQGYLPYLDGLRGIAIILVLLLHAGVPFIKGGWIGVDIFFALSGFLITALLMREQERSGRVNLRHFYLRRALRLLPAVVVLLAVFLIVAAVFMTDWPAKARDALYVLFYVANWVRAFGYGMTPEISHCWSLSIEEQFYFVWPLLFIAMAKLRLSFGTMAGIALIAAIVCAGWRAWLLWNGAPAGRLYFGLDTRFDSLLLGCALALGEAMLPARRLPGLIPFAAFAFITFIAFRVRMTAPWLLYGGYFLIAAAAAVLIADLKTHPTGAGRAMTQWPPLVNLGRISYGLYLWHFPIFIWVDLAIARLDLLYFKWPLKLFVGGAISLGVAVVSYRLIEMPFLRLKSRFSS